jgi:hypothetical protein
MATTDRQDSDSGVHSISGHNTKDVAASPNLAQHIAGSAILGSEHSYLAA